MVYSQSKSLLQEAFGMYNRKQLLVAFLPLCLNRRVCPSRRWDAGRKHLHWNLRNDKLSSTWIGVCSEESSRKTSLTWKYVPLRGKRPRIAARAGTSAAQATRPSARANSAA